MIARLPSRLGLPVLVLLVAGCIDGDEKIWLKRDGSGRLEAVYRMPPMVMQNLGGAGALRERLARAAAGDPHVDLTRIAHRSEGGRVTFEIAGTFDDLRNLVSFPRRRLRDPARPDLPVKTEALFGQSSLTIKQLSLTLRRSIDLAPILPEALRANPALLGDSSLRYTVHLPVPVGRTNAPVTGADGRRLEWQFLLRDHLDEPMRLHAQASLPLPWWVWLTGGLLASVFLLLIALAARRLILARCPSNQRL